MLGALYRHPHAGSHPHLTVLDGNRLGQQSNDPCCGVGGVLLIDGLREENGEFVAAETGHKVSVTNATLHPVCHFGEHGVAGFVAQTVVHRLEVVEIDQENGHGIASVFQRRHRAFGELRSVGQPGQRIMARLVVQQLTTVLDRSYQPQNASKHESEEDPRRSQRDESIGRSTPHQVDERHRQRGHKHEREANVGDPFVLVRTLTKLAAHRRMEGGEGEQYVETEPERIDHATGLEPVSGVQDAVLHVGNDQRADGGDE